MKKVLVLAALAALVATSASALSIQASKHDLSSTGTGAVKNTGTNTEICVYCHTPHSADMNVLLAPLWNRGVQNVSGTTKLYNSSTTNYAGTPARINASDAPLCLSCHDGTVGNALVNPPNGSTTFTVLPATFTGNAVILDQGGFELSNDHPVGIAVPAVVSDTGIFGAAQINTNLAGALRVQGAENVVWCSSCHDVHDNANAPFLIESNAGSALCFECHNK
jgi:predicted CXXCH cytochrome family protein